MHPRVGRHGTERRTRRSGAADQARCAIPCVLALVAWAGLAGCAAEGGLHRDADPRTWWRNLSGAYLDEREPPPGLDQPYPNLATVPARPVPPGPADRAALTAALAADRARARDTPDAAAARAAGGLTLPADARPPSRPALAAAPRIPWESPAAGEPAALTAPGAAAVPPGSATAPAPPAGAPSAAAPPPVLSGPPPAPSPELLSPPPAPGRELLAPRRD